MFSRNKPTCSDCKEPAYYAPGNSNYPTKCENHSSPNSKCPSNYTNIVEKACSNCKFTFLLGKTGLCDICLGYAEKAHHSKELKIKKLFDANGFVYESHDKVIDTDCNSKRPDFVFDYPFFKIIVEVDENQHFNYTCECEQVRMIEIHQAFGSTPVIFIRYNPDEFQMNGVKQKLVSSKREAKLLQLLNDYKNISVGEKHWNMNMPLSVIYMFYDDYDINLNLQEIKF